MAALRRPLDDPEDKLAVMAPTSLTGPQALAAAGGSSEARAAAVAADRAELDAIEARAAAARARGDGDVLRRDAQRHYEQATGRARAADARAAAHHDEWVAAYRAARAAGVDPGLLAYGVSRRRETRPDTAPPETP